MTQEQRWFGEGPPGALAQEALVGSVRAVRGVLDRPGYAFSDAEVLANLRAVSVLAAVVEAVKLVFVAELDDRPEAVRGGVKGGGAMAFLTEGLNQSRRQACRDLAAAKAVASGSAELPLMGAALADGAVSREHVDVAVATVRRIPKVLKTKLIEQPPAAGEPGEGEPAGDGGPATPAGDVDPVVGGGCRRGVDVIDEV